jgi:hypothetical protein
VVCRRRRAPLPLPVRLLARGLHPTLARVFIYVLARDRARSGLGHVIFGGPSLVGSAVTVSRQKIDASVS